jgi:hypothetical protein
MDMQWLSSLAPFSKISHPIAVQAGHGPAWWEGPESALLGHSAFAFGTALPAPQPTFDPRNRKVSVGWKADLRRSQGKWGVAAAVILTQVAE